MEPRYSHAPGEHGTCDILFYGKNDPTLFQEVLYFVPKHVGLVQKGSYISTVRRIVSFDLVYAYNKLAGTDTDSITVIKVSNGIFLLNFR